MMPMWIDIVGMARDDRPSQDFLEDSQARAILACDDETLRIFVAQYERDRGPIIKKAPAK